MTRLAVLGSPIGHSKSPALQLAAYAVLGLDWTYERIEAHSSALPGLLAQDFHGLSLTMPLKRDVLPLLDTVDEIARLTGGANTVLFDDVHRHGFNTDVAGIERAFARSGVVGLSTVQIVGAGATAASAIAAVHALGTASVTVFARTPANGAPLERLGETLGMAVEVLPLGSVRDELGVPDAVIDTLPGDVGHDLVFPAAVRERAVLFEVAYDPWPSALVAGWGGTVVDGLDMLIEQALVQVRIFVGGSPDLALPDEQRVLAAMRASVTR